MPTPSSAPRPLATPTRPAGATCCRHFKKTRTNAPERSILKHRTMVFPTFQPINCFNWFPFFTWQILLRKIFVQEKLVTSSMKTWHGTSAAGRIQYVSNSLLIAASLCNRLVDGLHVKLCNTADLSRHKWPAQSSRRTRLILTLLCARCPSEVLKTIIASIPVDVINCMLVCWARNPKCFKNKTSVYVILAMDFNWP